MNTVSVQVTSHAKIKHTPPRCRNARTAIVEHTHNVFVNTTTKAQAPLAFTWHESRDNAEENLRSQIRLYDNDFWAPVIKIEKQEPQIYQLNDLIKDCKKPFEHRHAFNFSKSIKSWEIDDQTTTLVALTDAGSHFEDISDIERLNAITNIEDMIVIDDEIWRRSAEPRYQVMTFGMGNNHGGTALMLDGSGLTQHPLDTCYFPATALSDAIRYAEKVAIGRGDTNYLPIKPHTIINVLIPEAVKTRHPETGHGYKIEEMSSSEVFSALKSASHSLKHEAEVALLEFIAQEGLEQRLKDHLSSMLTKEYQRRLK